MNQPCTSRVSHWTLIASMTALSLMGQTSQEDQMKAKKLAEAKQDSFSGLPAAAEPGAASATLQQKVAAEKMLKAKMAAEAMHVIASGPAGTAKLVKDKPFAAEAVTETVQVLTDGNRIVRRNLTREYRDRSGRTRREQTIESLGPSSPVASKQIVVISDPVAKADYILDPVSKTVRRIGRSETSMAEDAMKKALMERLASRAPAGPGDVKKEDLGKRTIEGLECTGTRTTATIPAGQIGNERPIVAVTETWYSADIEAVVQSTTADPRFGETTYNLRGVQRADQPPQLFEFPADYKK
jgi:hypothetical protein